MTDNEIIKELQCASEWFTQHGSNTNTAIIGICGRAVDLINRQKAEIERLKGNAPKYFISDKKPSRYFKVKSQQPILIYPYAATAIELVPGKEQIKAEAIKDFAEAYKEQIKSCTGMFTDDGFYVPLDAVLRFVEFCKEQMIGEQDESIQQEDC